MRSGRVAAIARAVAFLRGLAGAGARGCSDDDQRPVQPFDVSHLAPPPALRCARCSRRRRGPWRRGVWQRGRARGSACRWWSGRDRPRRLGTRRLGRQRGGQRGRPGGGRRLERQCPRRRSGCGRSGGSVWCGGCWWRPGLLPGRHARMRWEGRVQGGAALRRCGRMVHLRLWRRPGRIWGGGRRRRDRRERRKSVEDGVMRGPRRRADLHV